MRIPPPKITRTFDDAYKCLLCNPAAPESQWQPYPGSEEGQISCFRELVSSECQLAELVLQASQFFQLPESNTPLPDYNALIAMYKDILAWNTGSFQRLLPNGNVIPTMLFLE